MTILTVSTTVALESALASAHPGDSILLQPGTYSGVSINGVNKTSAVTIESANPSNPAVITSMLVQNSSGLTFANLTLSSVGATRTDPFEVSKSTNIAFSNIFNHGSLDGNPSNDVSGLLFENSQNVSVTASTFKELMNGLGDLNNTNVSFTNNVFSELGSDGIDNGGSSNVLIKGNTFTNFDPVPGAHPDAVQFWTSNTTVAAHDITVTGNSMVQGVGGEFQGVFVQDEVGNLPFQNLTISNNTVLGGAWNGVAVQGATNVNISGNSLTSVVPAGSSGSSLARILLENVNGAAVTDNVAAQYSYYSSDSALTTTANLTNSYLSSSASTLSVTSPITQLSEHATVSGHLDISDSPDYDPTVTLSRSNVVTAAGKTITGSDGHLTINSAGNYTYVADKDGLTVGQVYEDDFTTTIVDSHGQATQIILTFDVMGSGAGNSGNNLIVGGRRGRAIGRARRCRHLDQWNWLGYIYLYGAL